MESTKVQLAALGFHVTDWLPAENTHILHTISSNGSSVYVTMTDVTYSGTQHHYVNCVDNDPVTLEELATATAIAADLTDVVVFSPTGMCTIENRAAYQYTTTKLARKVSALEVYPLVKYEELVSHTSAITKNAAVVAANYHQYAMSAYLNTVDTVQKLIHQLHRHTMDLTRAHDAVLCKSINHCKKHQETPVSEVRATQLHKQEITLRALHEHTATLQRHTITLSAMTSDIHQLTTTCKTTSRHFD